MGVMKFIFLLSDCLFLIMVTKVELAEVLAVNVAKQLEEFIELNKGISKIRNKIIERLTEENTKLKHRIVRQSC